MGEANGSNDRRLVLLVDHDVESRRHSRHLLELRGMEVVQASNAIAALELVQRLPRSFRLVLTELDMPGIPGAIVIETLRLFRPDLLVLCMSANRVAAGASVQGCLNKPLQGSELELALEEGQSGWVPQVREGISEAVVARARARFAVVGDLVEAALELARGASGES